MAVAKPSLPPKQETFVCASMDAVGPFELIIIVLEVLVQPFASVTVTVYCPAANPVAVAVVCPDGFQL